MCNYTSLLVAVSTKDCITIRTCVCVHELMCNRPRMLVERLRIAGLCSLRRYKSCARALASSLAILRRRARRWSTSYAQLLVRVLAQRCQLRNFFREKCHNEYAVITTVASSTPCYSGTSTQRTKPNANFRACHVMMESVSLSCFFCVGGAGWDSGAPIRVELFDRLPCPVAMHSLLFR